MSFHIAPSRHCMEKQDTCAFKNDMGIAMFFDLVNEQATDGQIESYYLTPCRSFVTACQICLMHDAFQPMKHDRRLVLLIDCSHGSRCKTSAGLSKVHYCWSLHAYHIASIDPIAVALEAYDWILG